MVTVNISLVGNMPGNSLDLLDLTYTLDGIAAGTQKLSDSLTASISLGSPGLGQHVLTYTYPGDPIYPATTFSFTFQVSDTPFTYLGSSVMILYNAGDLGHVAIDSGDNAYFSSRSSNVILKRDTHGNLTTYPTTGLNKHLRA